MLEELLRYAKEYKVTTVGIFINHEYKLDIVFRYRDEMLKFKFEKFTFNEFVVALNELDGLYLDYIVNMRCFITLNKRGLKLISR